MALQPVARKSVSDQVFQQLTTEILEGKLARGDPLPTERDLSRIFKVSRQAVREARMRLEQMGLVESFHGSGSRVRDFRRHAGLDSLPRFLLRSNGGTDTKVLRGVLEMRLSLGADAARLAALRNKGQGLGDALDTCVLEMGEAACDLERLQKIAIEAWEIIVDSSENIPYRLAFNSLLNVYEPAMPLWAELLAKELGDILGWAALAKAIRASDGPAAHAAAHKILSEGHEAALEALRELDALLMNPNGPKEGPL